MTTQQRDNRKTREWVNRTTRQPDNIHTDLAPILGLP